MIYHLSIITLTNDLLRMSNLSHIHFIQNHPQDPSQNKEWHVDAQNGTSLLEAARLIQAPVQTLCHGIGACVRCKVKVVSGQLGDITALERDKLGNIYHLTKERMACQAQINGNCVLEIPFPKPKKYK